MPPAQVRLFFKKSIPATTKEKGKPSEEEREREREREPEMSVFFFSSFWLFFSINQLVAPAANPPARGG